MVKQTSRADNTVPEVCATSEAARARRLPPGDGGDLMMAGFWWWRESGGGGDDGGGFTLTGRGCYDAGTLDAGLASGRGMGEAAHVSRGAGGGD